MADWIERHRQIISSVTEEETLLDLIQSEQFAMQEKFDGVSLTIEVNDGEVTGFNKRMEKRHVPSWLEHEMKFLPGQWRILGELTDNGKIYRPFDLALAPALVTAETPFTIRAAGLAAIIDNLACPEIRTVPHWTGAREKFYTMLTLRTMGAEGVIFRPSRSSIHFPMQIYKYKFYLSVDCYVSAKMAGGREAVDCAVINDTDSQLQLGEETPTVYIGRCSVPARIQEPWPDFQVIEVRYRGLSKPISEQGKMIEPVLIRTRSDKPADECYSSQLVVIGAERSVRDEKLELFLNQDSTKMGITVNQFNDIMKEKA